MVKPKRIEEKMQQIKEQWRSDGIGRHAGLSALNRANQIQWAVMPVWVRLPSSLLFI